MDLTTLSFDEFWEWLMGHPNCILRAGTPDTILFDDEDFYWHLAGTGVEPRVVQVLRGKRLIGELLLEPGRINYVEEEAGEHDGEFVFQLISETPRERLAPYFFVLAPWLRGEWENRQFSSLTGKKRQPFLGRKVHHRVSGRIRLSGVK